MRFVALTSVPQQHILQVHRARRMAVRNRTAQANEIHGFLLEYGIESPKRGALLPRLAEVVEDAEDVPPDEGRALWRDLGDEMRRLDERVKRFDAQIPAIAAQEPACQRLSAIPSPRWRWRTRTPGARGRVGGVGSRCGVRRGACRESGVRPGHRGVLTAKA